MKFWKPVLLAAVCSLLLSACGGSGGSSDTPDTGNDGGTSEDLTSKTVVANQTAYIPPQCYTKTVDEAGKAHNPCMSCHIPSISPNFLDDGDLQLSYSFAEYANTNHWSNLFKDRRAEIASIVDEDILAYVRQDNYQDSSAVLTLAQKLEDVPTGWDFDKDGKWSGFMPDSYLNFDSEGFDIGPDGQPTGWRAFAYTPFLGTFWPTNGSTDDVLIRLGEVFQQNANGEYDRAIYKLNLAIVEALIARHDVTIDAVDENRYGVDLDKNGTLETTDKVAFDWAPLEGRNMSYVGLAKTKQEAGEVHLAAGLFPEGTEFLHSVRYLDLDDSGRVKMAARMKELRYARKTGWRNYTQLQDQVLAEVKEKSDFPDRLRQLIGNVEQGISNGQGWVYQGFIEDKQGALRPQTYEETMACMGCHGGIGVTSDSNFSFARKLGYDSFQHGWYHWSKQGLQGIPEPKRSDGEYEYTHYLEHNGAGDEFRENREVIDKFFDVNGLLKADKVEALHADIAELLLPSAERALELNKAYKVIVDEQSYIDGRDAVIEPPANIHKTVEDEQSTGVNEVVNGPMN